PPVRGAGIRSIRTPTEASLAHQLLGLLEVIGIPRHGRLDVRVERDAGGDRSLRHNALALVHGVAYGLLVEGMSESATDAEVVQRSRAYQLGPELGIGCSPDIRRHDYC